jgi:AcrR family transcriptional regulator
MKNTKQQILEAARKLFNESGYMQVTIRMIASELGISSGNLNYHFRKREDILEALYFEMVEQFDERVANLPNTAISFAQIRQDILSSMQQMVHYQFIWTDLYRLMCDHERIYDHFSKVHQNRIRGYLFLFGRLQEMGLMLAPEPEQAYEMLATRMVNFGDTWIYTSAVYQKENTAAFIKEQCTEMMMMLYPYLTKRGKMELLTILEE